MEGASSSSGLSDAVFSTGGKKTSKKKGERYLGHFKAKVVSFAATNSITEASKHYDVNRTTISDWIREQRKFDEEKPQPVSPKGQDIEKLFLDWLRVQREEELSLTRESVMEKLGGLLGSEGNEGHWLSVYLKRLKESSVDDTKHIMYSEGFRKEVGLLAVNLSKKSIEKILKVSRRRVQEWVKKIDEQVENPWCKKSDRSYPYVTDEKVDKKVWEWYSQERPKPPTEKLREKALELYKEGGYTKIQCSRGWLRSWKSRYSLPSPAEDKSTSDTELLIWALRKLDRNESMTRADLINRALSQRGGDFKASPGWAARFSKKYARFLQTTPHLDTKLPDQLEREIEEFQKSFHEHCALYNLQPCDLVAFDEVPLHFTQGRKRERLIRATGFENCHGSLIISCLADGTVLPTTAVLKEISLPPATERASVVCQERGVSDEHTQSSWAQSIFSSRSKCAVVCDGYAVHDLLAESLLNHFPGASLKVFQIPPGTNSKLNPCNVGLSAAFKSGIEEKWRNHSLNFVGGSASLPEPSNILRWVDEVHLSISEMGKEAILNAFQKTGLALINGGNMK